MTAPVFDVEKVPEQAIEAYYKALEPFWYPVMKSVDLEVGPVKQYLLGRPIVIVRLDGRAVAMTNVCRHLGSSLALGEVIDGSRLRCRYHGWQYDGTGQCVHIPLREDEEIPKQARVRTYACQERYGLTWVALAEEPVGDVAPFPEFDDDRFHKNAIRQHVDWQGSVPRLVMAALDDTHFSFVHPDVLGPANQAIMPNRLGPEPVYFNDEGLLVSRYTTRLPVSPLTGGAGTGDMEPAEFTNYVTVNSVRNVVGVPAGTAVTWNVFMPVTYNVTRTFTVLGRDYDKVSANDESYEDFNLIVKEQDREIVENQRPWLLPPIRSQLLIYVRPEDAPLLAYQKWLEDLGVRQI